MSSRGATSHDVVLVHGAVHGAWCWEAVLPHLHADPPVRHVAALDLPGHGDNRSIPDDEITLEDYVATVVDAVTDRAFDRVILVGHSLAGITTPASHQIGDRLRRLGGEQADRVGATVVSLDAGHSPFVTHPEELAALIVG